MAKLLGLAFEAFLHHFHSSFSDPVVDRTMAANVVHILTPLALWNPT